MSKNIKQLAEEKGLKPGLIYNRLSKGWTLERALNTPVGKRTPKDNRNEMAAMAVLNGIPENIFLRRVGQGWNAEKASTAPYSPRKRKRKKSTVKVTKPSTEVPLVSDSDRGDGMVASAMIIAIVVVIIVAAFVASA
jgi:hypothetical protein